MVKFADNAERVIFERYIANEFYCYAKSAKVTIFISRFSSVRFDRSGVMMMNLLNSMKVIHPHNIKFCTLVRNTEFQLISLCLFCLAL